LFAQGFTTKNPISYPFLVKTWDARGNYQRKGARVTAVEDRQSEFLVLYNRAQPLLRGFLLAWFRDFHRAEEILQQTSLELWKNFAKYQPDQPFEAWALGVARNQALKELRRQKTVPVFASQAVMEVIAAATAEMAPELERRRDALVACLKKLSSSFRKLVGLYYGQGLSIVEVARATGRPRGSVEVSLWRARQQLANCARKALERDGQ
jgi:RNA polymerase sigma-70 factor, ECF subfamily